jgi:uracil-DNA glycosylase family 4
MPISARESLNKLDREVISCKKCLDLVKAGSRPVSGKGASKANIMIVSTFPLMNKPGGKKASPGVFNQSELIIKIFERTGLSLVRDTYITSLIKCSPGISSKEGKKPSKVEKKPLKKHINNCITYLTEEISIITPHIIVSMGLDSSNIILEKYFSVEKKYRDIKKLHMKIFENPSFKLVPFYDPQDIAVSNAISEEKFLNDFESLSKFLKMV